MKLLTYRRRQSGMSIAVLLVLMVLFLVFIGTLAYIMWKAIQRLPTRPASPDETAATVQQATADELLSLQAANPGQPVTVQMVDTKWVTAFVPFGTNSESYVTVERSTNLVDWEVVATLGSGEVFADTNMPPDRAFYRSYTGDYQPVAADTNHVPGFYSVPQ